MTINYANYDDSPQAIKDGLGVYRQRRESLQKLKRGLRYKGDPSFFERVLPLGGYVPSRRVSLPLSRPSLPGGCDAFLALKKLEGVRERVCVSEAGRTHTHTHTRSEGLSNVPYLPVPLSDAIPVEVSGQVSGDELSKVHQLLQSFVGSTPESQPYTVAAELRPASVKLRVESDRAKLIRMYHPPHVSAVNSSTRGRIVELSQKARSRLAEKCYELTALGHIPELMVTLTYPGKWLSVASSGQMVKGHLQTFRKRLERYLIKYNISLSALWFLEFQKRGAPHFHLILWGGLSVLNKKSLKAWVSRNWAAVVKHSELVERWKHEKAGTQVAKMKCEHFGYAVKYATKMQQKSVPSEMGDVGRFWGLWNVEKPVYIFKSFKLSAKTYKQFGSKLLQHLIDTVGSKTMLAFGGRLHRLLLTTSTVNPNASPSPGFTVTIFGESAKNIVAGFV
jgi:hypothetical protein